MIPTVGTTCKFEFISKFEILNGIYRVVAETTFKDSIASGISYTEKLYKPSGLTEADFAADYGSYRNDRVSILESVSNKSVVIYTPESTFLNVPDPTVREYLPLTLVVDLGVQKNNQAVIPLIEAVKDLVRTSLGTTEPTFLSTNPNNKVYLTDEEYLALEVARAENKELLQPLAVQLHARNETIARQAAIIAEYEALIMQFGATAP